jgi:hypothetical protein
VLDLSRNALSTAPQSSLSYVILSMLNLQSVPHAICISGGSLDDFLLIISSEAFTS